MNALLQIIAHCLAKNFLFCTAFFWILSESRHLLGIGTRLVASSDDEFVHANSTWTKGEVMAGFSDIKDDDFQRSNAPFFAPVLFVFFTIFFISVCICLCLACQRRQSGLWSNVDVNPNRPAFEIYPPTAPRPALQIHPPSAPLPEFEIYPPSAPLPEFDVYPSSRITDYPPVIREEVRPPVGVLANDAPPNYTQVVAPRNPLETPPPAYTTVAPFK